MRLARGAVNRVPAGRLITLEFPAKIPSTLPFAIERTRKSGLAQIRHGPGNRSRRSDATPHIRTSAMLQDWRSSGSWYILPAHAQAHRGYSAPGSSSGIIPASRYSITRVSRGLHAHGRCCVSWTRRRRRSPWTAHSTIQSRLRSRSRRARDVSSTPPCWVGAPNRSAIAALRADAAPSRSTGNWPANWPEPSSFVPPSGTLGPEPSCVRSMHVSQQPTRAGSRGGRRYRARGTEHGLPRVSVPLSLQFHAGRRSFVAM